MVGKVLYWGAVFAISLAFVVGLILFFESRDDSSVEGSAARSEQAAAPRALHLTVDRSSRD